ncbi:unnamed protein product [Closterium sp. NIES-65]|nr:unnamed protein product [Closterium sp. NIES-65]
MPRAREPAADRPDGAPRMVVVVVSAERRGQGAAQRGAGREMGDERSAEGGDAQESGDGRQNAARRTLAGDDVTDGGAGGDGGERSERSEGGERREEAGEARRAEMEGEARLLLSIERSIMVQSSTYFAALLSSFREASLPMQHIHWDPMLFAHLLPHLLPALPRPALSAPHIPGLLAVSTRTAARSLSYGRGGCGAVRDVVLWARHGVEAWCAVYFGVPSAVRAASCWAHSYCSPGREGLAGRSSVGAGGIAMRKGSGEGGRGGGRSGRRAGERGCPWVCFPAPVSDVHWLADTWTAARDAGEVTRPLLALSFPVTSTPPELLCSCSALTRSRMASIPAPAPHVIRTHNLSASLFPSFCACTFWRMRWLCIAHGDTHMGGRVRSCEWVGGWVGVVGPSGACCVQRLCVVVTAVEMPYLACEQRHCLSLLPASLLRAVLATHHALLNVPRQAAAAPPPTPLPAPSVLPFQVMPCSCLPTHRDILSATLPPLFPMPRVHLCVLCVAVRCSEQWLCEVLLWWALGQSGEASEGSSGEGAAHEGFFHWGAVEGEEEDAEWGEEKEGSGMSDNGYVYMQGAQIEGSVREGQSWPPLLSERVRSVACNLMAHVNRSLLPLAFLQSPLGQLFQSLAAAATHHTQPSNEHPASTRDDSSGASSISGSSSGSGREQGGGSEEGRVRISPWTQVYSFSGCCSLPPDAFLSSSLSLTHHARPAPIAPCTLACPPLSPTSSSTPSTQHSDHHLAPNTAPTPASQHLLPLPLAPLHAHLDISHCSLLQPSHLRTWAAAVPPPLSLRRLTARSCPVLLPVPTLHELSSFCPKLQSADFSLPEPPVFCRGVAGSGWVAAALPGAGAGTGASVADGDGVGKSKGGSKKTHKGTSTGSITGASGKKKQASVRTPSAVAPSGPKGRHSSSAGQGRRAAHQAGDRRVDGGGGEEQEEEEEEQEGEGDAEDGKGEEGVGETASMLVPLHRLYNPWRLNHVTSLSLRWQQHLSDGQLMDVVLACPALTHVDITGCTSLSDRALAALISSYTRPPPAPASRTAPTVTSARQQRKGGHSSARSHCSKRPSPRHSGRCIGELPRCRLQLSHLCASHTHLGVRSLLALSRALTAAGGAREGSDDGDCGEAEEEEEEEKVKEVDEDESEDDEEEEEEDEEEGDGASEGHEEGDEEGVGEGRRKDCGVSGTYGGLRKLELDGCPAVQHARPLLHLLTAASPSLTHLSLAHTLAPGRMGEPAAPKGKGRGREAQGGAGRGEGCSGAVDDALVMSWLHGAHTLATQAVSCTTAGSSSSSSSDGTAALPHLTHLNVSDAPVSQSHMPCPCPHYTTSSCWWHVISALCYFVVALPHPPASPLHSPSPSASNVTSSPLPNFSRPPPPPYHPSPSSLRRGSCHRPAPPRPPSSSAPSSPPITTITIPPHLTTLHASWALPLSLSIPPHPPNPPTSPSSVCPSLPPPLPRLFPLSHSLRALALGLGATISDASLRAIAACCPRLTALSLTFQPVSDDGLLPLLAACPLRNLSLLRCGGPFSPALFSPPLPTAQASVAACVHHGHAHPHAHSRGPSLLAHSATLPRLTSLSLGGGFAWLSTLHFTALASAAPLLRSLSLSSCPFLSQDAPLILANSFPALTSLTLTECPNLFNVHAPASLFALSALSSLHLRHTGKQAPPDFIQQASSRLPALQHLTLDLCDALSSSFHVPQEGRAEMHVMGDSLLAVRLFKCHVLHSSHAHSLTALTPSDSTSGKRTLGTKDVLVIARTTNGIATSVENVS